MRFAEQGDEGHAEDLFVEIIADVQDPAAPVLRAGRHDERPHHEGGIVLCLSEIAEDGAAPVDPHAFSVGAVKIDLSHVKPPVEKPNACCMDSSENRFGKFG